MDDTRIINCCSFCGKSSPMLKCLITGHGVNICDECVETCVRILAEDKAKEDLANLKKKPSGPTAKEWVNQFVAKVVELTETFPEHCLETVPQKLHSLLPVLDDLEPKNLAAIKKNAAALLRSQRKPAKSTKVSAKKAPSNKKTRESGP